MKDLGLLRESLVASCGAEKTFCERHTRPLTCETAFVCFGPLGQAPVSTNGGQGGLLGPMAGSGGGGQLDVRTFHPLDSWAIGQ